MPQPLDLETLLDPARIALIGASGQPGKAGYVIGQQLTYTRADLFFVHPSESKILGHTCYRTIESLPENIDLAVIAVGAQKAVTAAQECARKGVKNLIIVAGGFSEAGLEGKKLEDRLKSIRQEYGTRILGPNTLGIFLPHNQVDTLFVEHGDKSLSGGGSVACISQSGSVGVEALGLASNTGFGMRAFIGLGNKCDLDELDFLNYFGKDPDTQCLAFYLESFDHGRAFLHAAKQIACHKPILVLKAGRTAAGATAVSSHTGRLAGNDAVVSGAFRQFGIQRTYDDEELCDAAKALSMLPIPKGNRVAVLTPAGGYGVMAADHIEMASRKTPMQMAQLSQNSIDRIRKFTFEFASCQNPIDLTAGANDSMMGKALDVLIQDPDVDMIILIAFFAPVQITDHLVEEIARRSQASEKPIIVFTQYGPFTDKYLLMFHQAGVVGFPSINRAVRAARFLVERKNILDYFACQS